MISNEVDDKVLQEALDYAAKGWAVFPIKAGGKAPATANGFKDASTSADAIHLWFSDDSNQDKSNIALRTGRESGVWVLDIDPRNSGTVPAGLPNTLTAITGGGGLHFYFTYPTVEDNSAIRWRKTYSEGVDIKADGGYVLLPPSFTDSEYRWANSATAIAATPDWLLEACTKPAVEPVAVVDGGYLHGDLTDNRPGSVFNRQANWSEILEPHGWTAQYADGDEVFWCRPGKTEGVSATTNYNGTGLLYCFTSSTEFEPSTAYTPFAVYTVLNHGGDYKVAAESLAMATVSSPTPVKVYHFEPAFSDDSFIGKYIRYCNAQTDAPMEYAEVGALSLISLATSRCRASLAPYPQGLSFNLYAALVGETTRSRKSTVQRITSDIAKQILPASILPNRATTEALINALASRNGLPSLWLPDEFGVALAEIYHRDFMSGLEELLLSAYSNDDYNYEKVSGTVSIRSPYLSILAAATPESLSRSGPTASESGLLPRFAVVYPKVLPEPRAVATAASDLSVQRANIISHLQQIQTWANTNGNIKFTERALNTLNAGESTLHGAGAARLPTMLYKVSALSACSRMDTLVSEADALAAIAVVNRWAEGMASLVPLLYRSSGDALFDKQTEFALATLDKHPYGEGCPRSVIAAALNVKASRLDEVERALLDRSQIRVTLDKTIGGKVWSRP
jgi:hypothetical protein